MHLAASPILAFLSLVPAQGANDTGEREGVAPYRSWSPAMHVEREPWIYAARVIGRVVDGTGRPVAGAEVRIKQSGFPGADLAETRTDRDGRFELRDLEGPAAIYCRVEPSEELLPTNFSLGVNSQRLTDMGDLVVKQNTGLVGIIEALDEEGSPVPFANLELTLMESYEEYGLPQTRKLGVARVSEAGVFRLGDFHAEKAKLRVRVKEGRKNSYYDAELEFEPGVIDRAVRVVCDPETLEKKSYSKYGTCRVEEGVVIPPEEPPGTVRGRVSMADGPPLRDVFVSAGSAWTTSTSVRTDAQGWFELPESEVRQWPFRVSTPIGSLSAYAYENLIHPNKREASTLISPEPYLDVVLEVEPIAIRYEGLEEDEQVELVWRHEEWLPIAEPLVGSRLTGNAGTSILAARRAGSLPAIFRLEQRSTEIVFDFGAFEPHELVVTSAGRPLEGARVRIRSGFMELADELTGTDGRRVLDGQPRSYYYAYVSAPGHRPRHVAFEEGRTEVELESFGGELVVNGLAEGEELRVVRAGSSMTLLRLRKGAAPVELPAGAYEALVLVDGELVRGGPFTIGAGNDRTEFDASVDRLPRVVLELPGLGRPSRREPDASRWWAVASRFMPSVGAVGAVASSSSRGASGVETYARIVRQEGDEIELLLPGSGRHSLTSGTDVLPAWFVRWETFDVGERRRIEVPESRASLSGRLDAYDGDQGWSHHGIAGPRLFLDGEGEDGPGWSLMVAMPDRNSDDTFDLDPIPAGTYHLMQHLREKGAVYGGTRVVVTDEEPVEVASFAEPETGSIHVSCVGSDGPVRGRLAIHDPMAASWTEFGKIPTTARYADDPIRPVAPTELAEGKAELLAIQAGLLELHLELEGGQAHAYRLEVEPGESYVLRVP